MRSVHAEAVTLNLAQDLAIEVRRHANRAPAVLQVIDPSDANLVLRVGPRDLSPIEGASITVTERRWTARSCGVKPDSTECGGGKIGPPIRKILVDITQDVRTLHCRTKGTSGAIGLRRFAGAYAEKGCHKATNRARHLVAVEIEICITLYDWSSKITLHAIKECADRIGWEGGSSALKVNEDCQFIARRAVDRTGVNPGANSGDVLLGVNALSGSTWRFKVDKVIKPTECQVEQINVVAHLSRQEARCKGEATRDAIDRRLRLWEERRYARIALNLHAVMGERDFRSALWRVR